MRHLAILLVLLIAGCAKYEYDIIRPDDCAGHVGTKADLTCKRLPLEYRMRSMSNYLVMRIYNPTDETITLQGQQSFVVDPEGQSHALRTQAIAPKSFMKLIIPPPRPRLQNTGPTFGIGVGTYVGDAREGYYHGFNDDWDEPRYFTVYDYTDSVYWDWKGTGEARLMLAFERDKTTFTQEFVIGRVKM